MSELDVNNLLNALENESNASIMNLTSAKIKSMKNNILQKLQLDRETLKSFHKKLKGYRYCTDMADVQYGYYVRWIPLKNPENLKLTNGGILMDIDIINNKWLVWKSKISCVRFHYLQKKIINSKNLNNL